MTDVEGGLLLTTLSVFTAAALLGLRVIAGKRRGRPVRPLLTIGAFALTALLGAIIFGEGHPPIYRRYETVVLAAWVVVMGVLVVDRRARRPILSSASAPSLALLSLFAILLVPAPGAAAPDMRPGTIVHIVLAVLGFVGFTVAAGTGVLYLWEIRILKRNPSVAVARRMPPLEQLDRLNFFAAGFGFPFLALSVLAGWLFLATTPERATGWWLDPTVLATVAGLLVYGLLFLARACLGWYGRRIAWLSVIGFFLAVVGFVVARFCPSPNAIHIT